ncbi:glycoside hydrolase family 16 protein [Fomitiporia mediterranea MF3/22]|uniref:glycoside hydrolase family 16 protein n=1 Tax=Fomitiporia mediterranea (strain MF3/22) TaxID=694068 RepID=UPI0004408AE8|nr:glycoside hydrolase family 16 protein [Fomitiporia mediterranea MF3/22]EJD03023.1 glycoside hydrolase family 16 protein [Fomitiporia mediterranea MF3/22]
MFTHSRGLITLLLFLAPSVLAQFNLRDTFIGDGFFSGFRWETFDDPSHGRVNYVDQQTAIAEGLSYVDGSTFFMRADDTTVLDASTPRGRNSVRITSLNSYTDAVIVLDVQHMPEGCATWPAFWTMTTNMGAWPAGGEIDIVEGVNLQTQNLAALHTSAGCTMPATRSPGSLDCDAFAGIMQGCTTNFAKPNSFGSALNSVGGGWFALKRTDAAGAAVYFWPRNDPSVPAEVASGAATVNPDGWGEPEALFPTDTCNWPQFFDAHNIIFDLTFCGDWAGTPFLCGGASTCNDYVDANPTSFQNAFWQINALRVYTP